MKSPLTVLLAVFVLGCQGGSSNDANVTQVAHAPIGKATKLFNEVVQLPTATNGKFDVGMERNFILPYRTTGRTDVEDRIKITAKVGTSECSVGHYTYRKQNDSEPFASVVMKLSITDLDTTHVLGLSSYKLQIKQVTEDGVTKLHLKEIAAKP